MHAPARDKQEGPQQAGPGRKRRYSQESLAEEMLASYREGAGPTKKARLGRQALAPTPTLSPHPNPNPWP